ncbi:unnamed protein product [Prunus armeniaca]|uniref:Late embryogenesis abundant protein LEA-2 subgroup domain-containing protein n=1 Tax=Prunus armeniaca TaxID=36596 RepID=A0A6J5VDD9_PRUAR|nr:unnamed protein product [Prunus armeniaca]
MASTTETNQPRSSDQPAIQSSEAHQPRAPTDPYPPPPGGTYPPSNMNYAHPQGYPTVAPPYHGYHASAYNPYYRDPYYTTTSYNQADEAASSCFRCFCIIMFLLVIFTLLASIVMFVVVRPETPAFKVESFSVSNFNLVPGSKVLSGKWEASIYVDNPSYRMKLDIDRWETSLYHKDNYLATGSVMHSMNLDSRAKGTMHMKMETYNTTASSAVEDMEKEQKEGGNVSFNLRLTLSYDMKAGGFFYNHYSNYRSGTLRVKCSDLKVPLPAGSNTGSMPSGSSKACDISDGF